MFAASAPVKSGKPTRQSQEGRKIEDRLVLLIGAEAVKDLLRQLVLDRDGKQRAKDHIGGSMGGLCLDLDRLPWIQGRQTRNGGFGGRVDRRITVAQPSALKRGIDDAALTLPLRAIGQEN